MSEEQRGLEDLVDRMLAGVEPRPARHGAGLDGATWQSLQAAGLTTLLVPEALGGSGATFADLAVVLRGVGYHGAVVPLAEASLAGGVLGRCDLETPAGITTYAFTPPARGRGPVVYSKVGYGRAADHVVVLEADGDRTLVRLAAVSDAEVEAGENLAGEPVDRLAFAAPPDVVGALDGHSEVWGQAAACRALLQAGALERIHELTLAYANEREQFGRPIVRFQAVQQMVVATYGATSSARAVTDAMVDALVDDRLPAARRLALIAAARSVCAWSAATAARSAHQVHGAMGFTTEHPLHAVTTRVLAWRDQDGTDAAWSRHLGSELRRGERPLWELITRAP